MKKSIAVWLLVWMVFLAFGQGSAFAAEVVVNPKVDPKSQQEKLARLGEAPVNINHKTNWDKDNIFVLVREACGSLQSKNRTTGQLSWKHLCLPVGAALDVPRGSTFTLVKDNLKRDEWTNVGVLDLPDGEATVTACGNGFKPTQKMIGKLDVGRQCPACEPIVAERKVPIASMPFDLCKNREGLQERVPAGYQMDPEGNCVQPFEPDMRDKRRVWPWVVGGIGAALLGYLLSRDGEDNDCNTCDGRIPYPAP